MKHARNTQRLVMEVALCLRTSCRSSGSLSPVGPKQRPSLPHSTGCFWGSGLVFSMPLQVPRNWIRRMSITAACRLGKHTGNPIGARFVCE